MRMIKTVDELKGELAKVRAATAVSDAARRQQFLTFAMELPDDFPNDPESEAYRERQFALYRAIAGRPYDIANETTSFKPGSMADKPFPYLNEGWEVTGDQLIAIGWLFKTMRLPPGASILEFGPGWGNATLALAQNGYRVTAIEIERNFIELIAVRAQRLRVEVDLREGDFLIAESLGRRFDALLFFESFHHCADHSRLFDLLPDLLAPDGIAVFCAEPIDEGFRYPWSLRLDGQSLWAIRANGWLELGFTESYFVRSLMRRGFVVNKRVSDASPLATCLVARRCNGVYALSTFYMPPDEDCSWGIAESDPAVLARFTGHDSRLTLQRGGPFGQIRLALRNYAPFALTVTAHFGESSGEAVVAADAETTLVLAYDPEGTELRIGCPTWCPRDVPGAGSDPRSLGISVSTVELI